MYCHLWLSMYHNSIFSGAMFVEKVELLIKKKRKMENYGGQDYLMAKIKLRNL